MILGPSQVIPEGEYRVFRCGNEAWLVARLDGSLLAVRDLCSHQPRPLNGGRLVRGIIECPHHATAYDLRSGEVVEDCGFSFLAPLERHRCDLVDGVFHLGGPIAGRV